MNNIERMFAGNSESALFASAYTSYFGVLLRDLDTGAIARVIAVILHARETGNRIFFVGNGGSASTASHFANDLAIGARTDRKPFKAISLCDNQAILTALGNDDGFDQIFVKQLAVLMEPEDVLIAISASGNSPNLVAAVNYANSLGAHTIGLTGFDGGMLKQLCPDGIHVATERGEYGPVESVHAYLIHLIGNYLLQLVKAERAIA